MSIPPTSFLLIIASVALHAFVEARGDLAGYLCELTGQSPPPRWLAPLLTVLAIFNILVPLSLGGAYEGMRDAAFTFVAGALLADAFGTHLIPTILTRWEVGFVFAPQRTYRRASPATWTTPAYLIAASALGSIWGPRGGVLWLSAGAAAFLGLWPGLLLLRVGRRFLARFW